MESLFSIYDLFNLTTNVCTYFPANDYPKCSNYRTSRVRDVIDVKFHENVYVQPFFRANEALPYNRRMIHIFLHVHIYVECVYSNRRELAPLCTKAVRVSSKLEHMFGHVNSAHLRYMTMLMCVLKV